MANESSDTVIHKKPGVTQKFLDEQTVAERAQRSKAFRAWHFLMIVFGSFARNRCPVRASALSYSSLLALVPMLAVAVSVTSSLLKKQGEAPIDRVIERMVDSFTPRGKAGTAQSLANDENLTAARKEAVQKIKEFVSSIRSGALGVTGMAMLMFIAISMLSKIEDTFNDIWGVTRGRTWYAKIIQYWAALTLGPILLIVALGLTSSRHLKFTQEVLESMPVVGSFISQLLPMAVLSLAFAAFYRLMPNTKVHWRPALIGGVVGGGLWHLNSLLSVVYVSRVVTNSKIYGSLGMIPVFMIGMYFSWLILLFGAQVAYAWQNREAYLSDKLAENVDQRGRELLALRIVTVVGQRFQHHHRPPSAAEIALLLGMSTKLTAQILTPLLNSRILLEVAATDIRYAPARPLDRITAHDVLTALRTLRKSRMMDDEAPGAAMVRGEFERVMAAEESVASGITIKSLVERTSMKPTS